jgi:hypothetical protein
LSWKNNCSPAVKTNSEPQSLHFKTLSVNSMTGFPKEGNLLEIGHGPKLLAGPVSLSSCCINNEGPGRSMDSGDYCTARSWHKTGFNVTLPDSPALRAPKSQIFLMRFRPCLKSPACCLQLNARSKPGRLLPTTQ